MFRHNPYISLDVAVVECPPSILLLSICVRLHCIVVIYYVVEAITEVLTLC